MLYKLRYIILSLALVGSSASLQADEQSANLPIKVDFPPASLVSFETSVHGTISWGVIPDKIWRGKPSSTGTPAPRVLGLTSPAQINYYSGIKSLHPEILMHGTLGFVDPYAIPLSSNQDYEVVTESLAFMRALYAGFPFDSSQGSVDLPSFKVSYKPYINFFNASGSGDKGMKFYIGAPTCAKYTDNLSSTMSYCGRQPVATTSEAPDKVTYTVYYNLNPRGIDPKTGTNHDGLWLVFGNDPIRRSESSDGVYDGTYMVFDSHVNRPGTYYSEFKLDVVAG